MSNYNFLSAEQLESRYWQDPHQMNQVELTEYINRLESAVKTETLGVNGLYILKCWVEQAQDTLNLMKGGV